MCRHLCLSLCLSLCLVLCLTLATAPAFAGEGEATSETWTYAKDGSQRVFDVTHMEADLREALHDKLIENGWSLQTKMKTSETVEAKPKTDPQAEPKDAKAPAAVRTLEDLRRDIAELVKRGGKLPASFRPVGPAPAATKPAPARPTTDASAPTMLPAAAQAALTKALGTVLLKYLEEKDDPARAAVYEEALRHIGTAMAGGEAADLAQWAPRLMGHFVTGLQDPAKAPVYREILGIFGRAMADGVAPAPRLTPPRPPPRPVLRRRPGRAPPAPRERPNLPQQLGGAALVWIQRPATSPQGPVPQRFTAVVRTVPADSLAAAVGLVAGDTLVSIDGKAADPAAVAAAGKAFVPGGKLGLRLRRKDGTIEVLDVEFESADD